MAAPIAKNVRNVCDHYNKLFSMLDRDKTFVAEEFKRLPPIVNMGYWALGAKTARAAQEQFVHQLAARVSDLRNKRVLDGVRPRWASGHSRL